jgi:hypothetical protein
MSVITGIRSRLSRRTAASDPVEPPTADAPTGSAPERAHSPSVAVSPEHRLTPEQRRFFDTFGFLKLEGLFAADIESITEGFEAVFAKEEPWDYLNDLHFNQRRQIVPDIAGRSPVLGSLLSDPRTVGVVSSLLGDEYEVRASDGSIFSCDTSWHADTFDAPLTRRHVKISLYLDPLSSDSGAIRVLPGTNFWQTAYATELRRDLDDPSKIQEHLGVAPQDLPSWTIQSRPGDAVVWDFRVIHASFNGSERRRLLSLNFRESGPET